MRLSEQLYPNVTSSTYFCIGDYQPIIREFGSPIFQVGSDHAGDLHILYHSMDGNENMWGYLHFGWGSCPACDALQACESYKEIDELIEHLRKDLVINSQAELLIWFKNRDWETQPGWNSKNLKSFVNSSITILGQEWDI